MLQKQSLLLLSLLLSSFIILPPTAIILDSSTFSVGNGTGFVLDGSVTQINIYTANSSGSVSGADASIQIISPFGDSGIVGDLIRNESANVPSVFGPSNTSGYISLLWYVPESNIEIPNVEIKVNVTYGGDTYSLQSQFITITPSAVELTSTSLDGNTSVVHPGETVSLTFSSFSINGGDLSGIQVFFNSSDGIGNFSSTNVLTDSLGKASTLWSAPPSISEDINVTLQATATIRSGLNYISTIQIQLKQYDLNGSFILFSKSSIETNESVQIFVLANGTDGTVSNAEVILFQNSLGSFSEQSTTNSTGVATFLWTAPSVASEINVNFQAIITKAGAQITINKTLQVSPIIYTINLSINETDVEVNQTVLINLEITHKTTKVIGATISLTSNEGYFLENGKTKLLLKSDGNGRASAIWVADLIPLSIIGTTVSILVEAYGNETGIATNSANIHVKPLPLSFSYDVMADNDEVHPNEKLKITIMVYNETSQPYSGALVSISTILGVFESSNDTTAVGLTNSSGMITFVWIAKGFDLLDEPLDLNFSGSISISDLNLLMEWSFTTKIVPQNQSQSTGAFLSSSSQGGINEILNGNFNDGNSPILLVGIIGTIIGIFGVIFVIIKKKG